MTGPRRPRAANESTLALVRISLLLGILLFGGVSWYVQSDPSWEPPNPTALPTLRRVMFVAWALAIAALLALRPRLGRSVGPARQSLLVVAWAIGEGAALFSTVYFYMSGDLVAFLGGLVVMMGAMLLFPIRAE